MARRIIKKIGGDRLGTGSGMSVEVGGYGYSTHDVSRKTLTNITFGTIVPVYMRTLTTGSKLTLNLDALITSNALLYQLYGSAKFQLDVFSVDMEVYNPKMRENLIDLGYEIEDVKFPLYELTTRGYGEGDEEIDFSNHQINPSSLIRMLGVAANGQNTTDQYDYVTRKHNAHYMIMYYHIYKLFYANKQEKRGYIIDGGAGSENITDVYVWNPSTTLPVLKGNGTGTPIALTADARMDFNWDGDTAPNMNTYGVWIEGYDTIQNIFTVFPTITNGSNTTTCDDIDPEFIGKNILNWNYMVPKSGTLRLEPFELKAIDRMAMSLLANIENTTPILITKNWEAPYGSNLAYVGQDFACLNSQQGLAIGTYMSDVFTQYLDNATISALMSKSKVQVAEDGTFSIDALNLAQKKYNYDQRIGITDGTLEEWRELTYGQKGVGRSLQPEYEGGLSKEIVFDMVVSTAGTEQEPLGSIASRGQFGSKHKGGYVQIHAGREKLVMIMAKITPRVIYSQGNDWETNLKTLDDLHKPIFDRIGYQNLLTDQVMAGETSVAANGTLTTYSVGKQPAWQWYRTDYDRAFGNFAAEEKYKIFGRDYETEFSGGRWRIKDLTTYIDPTKYNDVFAIQSLDYMNFDLQVGIDAKLTMVMSEEVIPNL